MTSPMQVLEDVPKVWLVYIYGDVVSAHKTEATAWEWLNATVVQDKKVRKFCSVEWEVLHD